MHLVIERGKELGVATLCTAVGIPRSSFYRWQQPRPVAGRARTSPRALTPPERQAVRELLHAPRFVDLSPSEVYATLLDEGRYVCSERTMYRLLAEHQEVRERRNQLRHQHHAVPELLATRPNEVWSWDITKFLGPAKWTYFYLYVILDIFSRYVVGWMVAYRQSATLAQRLIQDTCIRQGITPGQLTVHADRGSSMIAKPVALLLADLGVVKTHSRPHVSNDNPFSEAQFKTLKYRPDFPERFGCLQDARAFSVSFFRWYNTEHRHTGIGLLTPHDLHHGLAPLRVHQRGATLTAAYVAHPERFPRGIPTPPEVPTAAWINKPMPQPSQRVEELLHCK